MSFSFETRLVTVLNEIESMLLRKNRKYGDSALTPINIFSGSSAADQLRCRIDDKLSRIKCNPADEDEDTLLDLIGYLILLRVVQDS